MATRSLRQPAVLIRRSPSQERAKASVEAILTATVHILEADGPAGLNTNRIAERAGVSIGTLYQYFPDKEAIVVDIARRILVSDRAAVMAALGNAIADPKAELDRVAVRETIRLYQVRPEVRRVVMNTMIGIGLGNEVGGSVNEVGHLLTQLLGQRLDPRTFESPDWQLRLFLATRCVEAAIRAGAYEQQPAFGTPAFEDALVAMVRGLLPEVAALRQAGGAAGV